MTSHISDHPGRFTDKMLNGWATFWATNPRNGDLANTRSEFVLPIISRNIVGDSSLSVPWQSWCSAVGDHNQLLSPSDSTWHSAIWSILSRFVHKVEDVRIYSHFVYPDFDCWTSGWELTRQLPLKHGPNIAEICTCCVLCRNHISTYIALHAQIRFG
jgi:hypothetical protein